MWHDFEGEPETAFSSEAGFVLFQADIGGSGGEINLGIDHWIDHSTTVYILVGYQEPFDGDGGSYDVKKDIAEYMQSERSTAQRDLQEWLEKVSFSPDYSVVEFIDITPAQLIQDCVRVHGVDLVVVGISGKSGLSRFLLGSVAEGVLRESKVDVLTG